MCQDKRKKRGRNKKATENKRGFRSLKDLVGNN
jgi:hypothetical protein